MEMYKTILAQCEEQCNSDDMMFMAVMNATKKIDKEEWQEIVLELKGGDK